MSYIGNQPSPNLISASDLDPAFSMPYGQVSNTTLPYAITNLLYPSKDGLWRDTYRAGWLPWSFNQQWGGTFGGQIINGATGALVEGDFLTGNVQDDAAGNVGGAAANYYHTVGAKVGRSTTNPIVWLKLYKTGNPTDNFTLTLFADSGGSPTGAALATATLSGKQITSKADGEWYPFTLSYTMAAGTQYHLAMSKSGGVDATNYYFVKSTASKKYPHGFMNTGTSAPVWTQYTGYCPCFLVQAPAASAFLQSSGQFDSKFVFSGAGSTLDQSDALVQPLRNFWDGKQFTDIIRGKSWTVSQPVKDYQYGIDHDRILVSITASGYAQLDVWDSGGTKRTVTGTTNISGATHSDIAVSIRSAGDGSDYIKLYVNGTSEGTPLTSLTLTFDPMFRELGHATLGGANAFSVPTWSGSSISTFSGLPSTLGWTGGGSLVTEGNAFSVSGGKLYQNKNAFDAAGAGSYYAYTKTTAGLSNTNGWTVAWKVRVPAGNNATNQYGCSMTVYDGTKVVSVNVQEYFVQTQWSSTVDFTVQGDFKSQDHVFTLTGKGSDYQLYIDGKLAIDGTGKLTNASANNQIMFGDNSSASGDNSDAIWSYVKYYTTAAVLPQFTSGSLSEYAHFSGDRTAILPSLYNSGTPVSVKSYAGVERNYVGSGVVQKETRYGVTSTPTTTSTSAVVLTDMEAFVIGSELRHSFIGVTHNSVAGNINYQGEYIDGSVKVYDGVFAPVAGYWCHIADNHSNTVPVGLHKAEMRWQVSSGTGTYMYQQSRKYEIEARS